MTDTIIQSDRSHGWLARLREGASGYVASGADALIWGVGGTADAAQAAAAAEGVMGAVIRPASPALVAEVETRGGDVAWRAADGIAVLHAEPDCAEWAAELIQTMPVPERARPWAPMRHAMQMRMLRAMAEGHPAVRLTPRGRVIWTEAAGTATIGTQRPGPLSEYRSTAAEEMADILGDDTWVRALADEAAEVLAGRRRAFRDLAEALWGTEWMSPAARALDLNLRTVQRSAAGERGHAPSEGALADLHRVARHARAARLETLRRWTAALEGVG